MARIQPSFFHFYLFRTRQHNTSFLLTSKDELNILVGSFLNNPNLLSIRPTTFPPQEQFKTESTNFSVHTTRSSKFCTYTSYSPIPFKISKTKVKPHSRGTIHNSVWPLTSQYFNTTRFSNPF